MSHPLLDHWLDQLAGALAGEDRDAALAEVRDHVESAYEAAREMGLTDEASAAAAALAEFGDAKQFANNFRGDPFLNRGRWMMRVTTAAAVAGLLMTGAIAVWWPNNPGAAPLASVAQAQAPGTTAPVTPKPKDPFIPETSETNNQATQEKLSKHISAELVDMPLAEVLQFLSEKAEVETYVNRSALEAAGVSMDAQINIQLKKVRGDMLLDLALQQIASGSIDYVLRDGIIVVTTVESIDGASDVKAYPVADLLKLHALATAGGEAGASAAPGPGGGSGGPVIALSGPSLPAGAQQLVGVVTSTVAPDSWAETGGHGTITYYGDMLIIRQNARTHREIEKVLKLLRDTAGKK